MNLLYVFKIVQRPATHWRVLNGGAIVIMAFVIIAVNSSSNGVLVQKLRKGGSSGMIDQRCYKVVSTQLDQGSKKDE